MAGAEEQLFERFGRTVPAGTVLFREGEAGTEMYVVQQGLVQVTKQVRDVHKVVALLGPGEFFGEMALLNAKPRSATTTVIEDAKLLVIDPKTFEAMMRGNIEIAVRLIRRLAARLEDSNEQIENLLLRAPASRVTHVLWNQASRYDPTPDGVLVPLLTRELPARLGLRQDHVDDVLNRLARARLAVPQDDGIRVPDVAKLKQYLDYLEAKDRFGDI